MLDEDKVKELMNNRNYDEFKDRFGPASDSVRRGKTYRLKIAEEQAEKPRPEKEKIIESTNEFLEACGLIPIKNDDSIFENPASITEEELEERVLTRFENYDGTGKSLQDVKDIVWMKFTKDGHLGVVAASFDIGFDIPKDDDDFNGQVSGVKKMPSSSGIIVYDLFKKRLCEKWNESFVLIFPLIGIPVGKDGNPVDRRNYECGIGNYLIEKEVPILDYYSHRLGPVRKIEI